MKKRYRDTAQKKDDYYSKYKHACSNCGYKMPISPKEEKTNL